MVDIKADNPNEDHVGPHDHVHRRKKRRQRQKKLVTEMFQDYAKNTTVHGIPYMAKEGVTVVEKIFWIITFMVSLCLCSYWIYQVWIKWKTSPVIVTVSEHVVPVSMVPFPSVTICPQMKCKISKYNFTRQLYKNVDIYYENNYNETDLKTLDKFEDINLVCVNNFVMMRYERLYSNYSPVNNIMEVSPDYEDVFDTFDDSWLGCSWRNDSMECDELFKKIITREGICYNMNSLSPDEIFRSRHASVFMETSMKSQNWSVDQGYANLADPNSYPRHGMENGGEPDLVVELVMDTTERDYSCNPKGSGFKVYVHHPLDLPQSSLYYYGILNDQVSSMALSFTIWNTSESLRSYDIDVRQCYFTDERYLRYFKTYTAKNCRMECLTNATYKKCDCVGFYMPHETGQNICTYVASSCIVEAEEEMVYKEANTHECHCLPACNAVEYEAEVLKTKYNKGAYYKKSGLDAYLYDKNVSDLRFSRLEMYYKKPHFISMRRSELFGLQDFLANCGGLLGLFLGFSFLSLMEIYYFMTLRLWCTLRKDLKEEKAEKRKAKSKATKSV